MREKRAGLVKRTDSVEYGGWASAQPRQLREDEPHPVALLGSRLKLGQRGVVRLLLRFEEALKLKWVGGVFHMVDGTEGWPGINGPRPTNR